MKQTWLPVLILAFTPLLSGQVPEPGPASWPAKDTHQGFTVAASPYTDAAHSKDKFGKADPYKAGILAVDVFFKNDTDEPVHVELSTIRLDVTNSDGQHFHLPALSLGQAAQQIAHPKGPSAPSASRFPLPVPSGDSKQRDVEDKLRPLTLQSDVVPPKGSIRGVVFFDVGSHFELVPHASLYVPDVKSVASDTSMIYFDVALGSKQPR